eukprot:TRINITY_DN98494_c0_g1_i1.p1 TRINITY_DN98494_c0_g1~~TRINITY_DN98494_c0_g1_i1.p1  ORF type:complete len:344 (+),score=34.57 TRINITY_DN98494_c0_g1_i1:59-1090(+)
MASSVSASSLPLFTALLLMVFETFFLACDATTTTTTMTQPPCTPETNPMDVGSCPMQEGIEPFTERAGACRGTNTLDACRSYYEVRFGQDQESCKQLCAARSNCTGAEFWKGRCELWTREIGLDTKQIEGFTCFRKNDCLLMPSGSGVGGCGQEKTKPCKLTCPQMYELTCIDQFKNKPASSRLNTAWVVKEKKREGWWRLTTTLCTCDGGIARSRFKPMTGGTNQACRGNSTTDTKSSYYAVRYPISSLDRCKLSCLADPRCKGIEFSSAKHRCEVWIREEGVGTTYPLSGFTCLGYEIRNLPEGRRCTLWQQTSGADDGNSMEPEYICLQYDSPKRRLLLV